ncbi:hypothetical protein EDB89DRAFT_1960760, partial [Lactarius sanguifluus]
MAAHTKLKFRYVVVSLLLDPLSFHTRTTRPDLRGRSKKRDLRADLLAAEAEARAKKRKAAGLPVEDAPVASEDEEAKNEAEATEVEREAWIATANPLLNLAAALGNAPGINTTAPDTFAVKRRWDDDLVFKNQAIGDKDKPQGQF